MCVNNCAGQDGTIGKANGPGHYIPGIGIDRVFTAGCVQNERTLHFFFLASFWCETGGKAGKMSWFSSFAPVNPLKNFILEH